MKSSVLTAALLKEGTAQSKALELRKVAFVLCFSPGTQTPFMYCGVDLEEIYIYLKKNRTKHFHLECSCLAFDLAFPNLQSGGMTAEVRSVDKAEAKDSNVATIKGSDVTQSTVLQIC